MIKLLTTECSSLPHDYLLYINKYTFMDRIFYIYIKHYETIRKIKNKKKVYDNYDIYVYFNLAVLNHEIKDAINIHLHAFISHININSYNYHIFYLTEDYKFVFIN